MTTDDELKFAWSQLRFALRRFTEAKADQGHEWMVQHPNETAFVVGLAVNAAYDAIRGLFGI